MPQASCPLTPSRSTSMSEPEAAGFGSVAVGTGLGTLATGSSPRLPDSLPVSAGVQQVCVLSCMRTWTQRPVLSMPSAPSCWPDQSTVSDSYWMPGPARQWLSPEGTHCQRSSTGMSAGASVGSGASVSTAGTALAAACEVSAATVALISCGESVGV